MSVAKCLGVDDLDAPNMQGMRAEWPRWQDTEPALNVVADIAALPRWMKQATPADRGAVLAALGRVAGSDRRAYIALAWLLVPGASLVAGRLCRFTEVIDEVVGRAALDPDLRARSGRRHVHRSDDPSAS